MIGITQLLNSKLNPPTLLGDTAETAFTSYDQVAASGQANGLYYFNDGTRTRQMYLDVDGTENGTGTGGWARWDSNIGGQYQGAECILADTGISSDGLLSVRSGNYPTGAYASIGNYSASHGACAIGGGNYVKANKIAFSDIYFPGHTGYYKNNRFQVYSAPATFSSAFSYSNAHYPGLSPIVSGGSGTFDLYMRSDYNPNPDSSWIEANKASYGIKTGYVYHLNGTTDKLFHWAQINYSSTNQKVQMKVWFKF